MSDLFLDFFRTRDRVPDFLPQQFSVTLTHPLHRGFDRCFRHRKFDAQLRVRRPSRLTRLIILQQIEKRGLVPSYVFFAQPIQSRLNDALERARA